MRKPGDKMTMRSMGASPVGDVGSQTRRSISEARAVHGCSHRIDQDVAHRVEVHKHKPSEDGAYRRWRNGRKLPVVIHAFQYDGRLSYRLIWRNDGCSPGEDDGGS